MWPWNKKNQKEEKESPVDIVRKTLGESKTGIETLKRLEQSGYAIENKSLDHVSCDIDQNEKKVFLNEGVSPEAGALDVIGAVRFLKHDGKNADTSGTNIRIIEADIETEQLAFAEEMRPKIRRFWKRSKKATVTVCAKSMNRPWRKRTIRTSPARPPSISI